MAFFTFFPLNVHHDHGKCIGIDATINTLRAANDPDMYELRLNRLKEMHKKSLRRKSA